MHEFLVIKVLYSLNSNPCHAYDMQYVKINSQLMQGSENTMWTKQETDTWKVRLAKLLLCLGHSVHGSHVYVCIKQNMDVSYNYLLQCDHSQYHTCAANLNIADLYSRLGLGVSDVTMIKHRLVARSRCKECLFWSQFEKRIYYFKALIFQGQIYN